MAEFTRRRSLILFVTIFGAATAPPTAPPAPDHAVVQPAEPHSRVAVSTAPRRTDAATAADAAA
eukprot:327741-Prymnesium_polylepis.1